MSTGRRYSKKEYGKLNIIKVVITIIIICIAIFCIYKLVNRNKTTDKSEVKELGREIIHEEQKIKEKAKTIDDYVEQYNAVLIDKVKDDTYYISIDGKECTLYSNGNLADGKIPLWNGESKEIKIDKDTKAITINTAEEFKWFADQIISGEKNFKGLDVVLNNNLDLGGRIKDDGTLDGNKWNSIVAILEKVEGSNEENLKGFAGTFDGNNHWIRGMIIESNNNYQGLFGYSNGTIRNLSLVNCYISGNEGVGAFVGLNAGKLDNCRIENVSVNGTTKVGGFVGINMTDSHIENCSTEKDNSTINASGDYAGGIVGYLNNNSDISNCENRSDINGKNYVGGLVGISFFGTEIINSSSIDSKILGEDYVGGLVGYSQSGIDKCFNKSVVAGTSHVGGIAGINYVMGNIGLSYNSGNVDAKDDFVGGIAGLNNATIVSTYNTGEVMSKATEKEVSVGGICGQNLSESAVNNSYNIGKIIGTGYTDGVVGANFGMISNCYYLESSIKAKTNMSKTEEEMKNLKLDDDFKPDSNNTNNGYLVLNWQ